MDEEIQIDNKEIQIDNKEIHQCIVCRCIVTEKLIHKAKLIYDGQPKYEFICNECNKNFT